MKEYIDASLFLGMNRFDKKTRIACKNFFVKALQENRTIFFHLEQVGLCDDIVWNFKRETQDAYYPFMDTLHSIMQITRIPYTKADFSEALKIKSIKLTFSDKLLIGSVKRNDSTLFSVNKNLNNVINNILIIDTTKKQKELEFPDKLEKLYKKSLKLKMGITGIIPPLVTPIDKNGNVCKESVRNLIEYVSPHSVAIMPALSSGEGWALNQQQFEDMLKYSVEFSKLPVLAGVEFETTKEVIKKALIAKKIGVDAVVLTTPFSKTISQTEIYKHFKEVDDALNMPIFIYNESEISGSEIKLNTINKICKLDNVVGIKEASGDIDFTAKVKSNNKNIYVYQGWEHLCYESKNIDGYILPLSNIEPKLCENMFFNTTKENQEKINNLTEKYNLNSNDWYKYLKKELYKRKIISTPNTIQ